MGVHSSTHPNPTGNFSQFKLREEDPLHKTRVVTNRPRLSDPSVEAHGVLGAPLSPRALSRSSCLQPGPPPWDWGSPLPVSIYASLQACLK